MSQFETLDLLFQQQGGTVRTAQAIEAGVSKPTFYDYVKAHGIEKVAHGIYASPDVWRDSMYLIHLRCKQAVFSHESALLFHDLTDREPLRYVITVKTGYNPSVLKKEGLRVYTVKEDLHSIGCTTAQTPFGHTVPVYDMERTICDIFRSRSHVEAQDFHEAVKEYLRRKERNIPLLLRYAKALRVERIMKPYLEAVLA